MAGLPHLEERKVIYTYEKDGFIAEIFTHVGQYGTHCDPPGHFHKGLRLIDEITGQRDDSSLGCHRLQPKGRGQS